MGGEDEMPNNETTRFLSKLLQSAGKLAGKNPIGRTLAHCYAHALTANPKLEKAILNTNFRSKGAASFARWEAKADEFIFKGPFTGKYRRADICVCYNGEPMAIVEIKVEDQDADDRDGQLRDYVDYATETGLPFHYITKYSLSEKETEILGDANNVRHRRHYEIAMALRQKRDEEIAQMIFQYLEDQKMAGYQPLNVEKSDLLHFVRRLLPIGFEGRANMDSSYKISQVLEKFLNNARSIGDWLIAGNEKKATVSVYPCVDAYWKVDRLAEKFRKDPKNFRDGYIADYFDYGYIYFVAQMRCKTRPPMWLSVSFWIGLEGKELCQGILVEIEGGPLSLVDDDEFPWDERTKSLIGYGEANIRRDIRKLIANTQNKLTQLENHSDERVSRFARSQTAQLIAQMEFPGLG
jgi:hypothetical protein